MEDVVVSDNLATDQRDSIRAVIGRGRTISCALYDVQRHRLVARGALHDVSEHGLGVRLDAEVREVRAAREFLAEFQAECGSFRILGAVRHVRTKEDGVHVGFEFLPEERKDPALFQRLRRLVKGLLTPWTLRR